MQFYKRVYCEFWGLDKYDTIFSEYSGKPAVDIHHLTRRGKGKDSIWNLIALTREEHERAESDPIFNEKLKIIHAAKIIERINEMLGL